MPFVMKNESFHCAKCGKEVSTHPEGSARNHCPFCLTSLHVDDEYPGDRASTCGAMMAPVDLDVRKNRGYVIIHECAKCKKRIANKTAPDDELMPFITLRNARLAAELPPR